MGDAEIPMTVNGKWLCIGSLIFAGLWGLFFSLLGCFEILGGLFVYTPSRLLAPYLLLVLEFPLFVLATVFSKRFILPLWAMAVIFPLAMILLARQIFIANSFMILVTAAEAVSFPILAALLRYGTRYRPPFYSLPMAKLAKLWEESKGIPYYRKF